MALTKNKLKSNIKQEMEEGEKGGNKKPDDSRLLPYFDLGERETMKILFLPDPNGELYVSYRKHGANIGHPGVKPINCCWTSSGQSCPICALSYENYKEGNEEEAKFWRSKETFLAQCVVIESDIEIPDNEDGNLVKLMYLPYKIKEKISEAMLGGEIEDPTETVFVLKKNKNSGGWNTYENSYWLHKDLEDIVPAEFFEAADEGMIEPYDLTKELPEPTTTEQVQEWLEDAQSKIESAKAAKNGASSVRKKVTDSKKNQQEDDDDEPAKKPASKTEKPSANQEDDSAKDSDSGSSEGGGASSSLRDRIKRNRK